MMAYSQENLRLQDETCDKENTKLESEASQTVSSNKSTETDHELEPHSKVRTAIGSMFTNPVDAADTLPHEATIDHYIA